ncbi:response regulator transcription factor [Aestuariivirga sp.]|uniref:response regulator transcription factor n=1 Tax=Aestuariivirga sp. TaxID=2650926 RepID=UPI00391CA344
MIIDDEEAVRHSLSSVLGTYGYETTCFGSAARAIDAISGIQCDCIVLDVRMPDMDGLTALRLLQSAGVQIPVIIITGHADVPMAVQAMKLGAVDFLEKPVIDEDLAQSIEAALAQHRRAVEETGLAREVRERFATLTPREQDVAALVVEGYASSAIAAELNISVRTVDHHRAAILAKMQATSLPQLLRFLLLARNDARTSQDV